jgi:Zn-dependent metalloprotease
MAACLLVLAFWMSLAIPASAPGSAAVSGAESGAAAPQYVTQTDHRTGRAIFMSDPGYGGGYAVGAELPHQVRRAALEGDVARVAADAFVAAYGAAFGPSRPAEGLGAYSVEADELGLTHVRYHQFHSGVPVFGADLFVHVDADGHVTAANGHLAADLTLDATAALTADDAIAAARVLWDTRFPGTGAPEISAPTLYVLVPELLGEDDSGGAHLVWRVVLHDGCGGRMTREYFLDAHDGVLRLDLSGTRQVYREVWDCTWTNLCRLDQYLYLGGGVYYWAGRSENAPVRGQHPVYHNFDTDDLHGLMGQCHQYYWDKFQRNGINGRGGLGAGADFPWTTTAGQVYLDGTSAWAGECPNAFFDYDGLIGFCSGTVVSDIVGHEYSHGLAFFSHESPPGTPVGMVYSGESGALDESQADVFGQLFEKYVTGTTDWIVGSQVPGAPWHRNLADPPSLSEPPPDPQGPYPDRYRSPYVYCGTADYAGVHHKSTVVSKAMYLMANGGAFNNCSIAPVGLPAAEQILYRAVAQYYTTTETFNMAYGSIRQATADLYGTGSDEYWQVTKALRAVELDQPGHCGGLPGWAPVCQCMAADIDRDGDVDISDFIALAECMNGPAVPYDSDCEGADLDADDDVDLVDFAALSLQFGVIDCNHNAVPDGQDIALGTSLDCNGNGVPDECDLATLTSLDCNANGIPDECDIAALTSVDCNANGVPDECDLAAGTSLDCNTNGAPDECDIASATSDDCQPNGIPDECELGSAVLAAGFENILNLPGWVMINHSQPLGTTNWFQGDSAFPAQAGPATSYIGANYNNTGSVGTISNWLLTPEVTLANGMHLNFYTRTKTASQWADRLQVRMSLSGASTDVGTTSADVGVFTTLLLDVNPTLIPTGYPHTWDEGYFNVTLTGIGTPTQGRLAFRYYVTNAGANGANSDWIGIDTVSLQSAVSNDCNANGIPDACDIAQGTSLDADHNGIPDECE